MPSLRWSGMSGSRRERLLHQVTRLREIEHRAAAAAASHALSEAARSRALADRAEALAAGYRDLAQVTDAHELAARRFAGERMRGISVLTAAQAETAAGVAETRVTGERQARRKREAIEEARARLELHTAKAEPFDNTASRGLARFLMDAPANHRGH
jgi:hypothetical protein